MDKGLRQIFMKGTMKLTKSRGIVDYLAACRELITDTTVQKTVLLYYAACSNKDGGFISGIELTAYRTSLGRTCVKECNKYFRELGILSWTTRAGRDKRKFNVYQIDLPRLQRIVANQPPFVPSYRQVSKVALGVLCSDGIKGRGESIKGRQTPKKGVSKVALGDPIDINLQENDHKEKGGGDLLGSLGNVGRSLENHRVTVPTDSMEPRRPDGMDETKGEIGGAACQ